MFWPFNKRCKHKWEILVDKFIKSNVERLTNDSDYIERKFKYLPDDLSGTNIVILQCTECGKVDKTVTKT